MAKEKYQTPALGDTVRLRLYVYNANALTNFKSVDAIAIYFLDPNSRTEINPDGRTLVEQITTSTVVQTAIGKYYVDVELAEDTYVLGNHLIQWTLVYENELNCQSIVENKFTIFPRLWATSDLPLIYDFDFTFRPNRITLDSKRWLTVEIIPKVQNADTFNQYYAGIALSSNLTVSICKRCGGCPSDDDDDLVVDADPVQFRERGTGYYFLSTGEDTDFEEQGLYDIWFNLTYGECHFRSPIFQLEIY